MILKRIKRKLYKATHPVVGEIWMLHRVVEHRNEKNEQRVLEVTPEWLEQKILEYQKKGYTFVSIDDLQTLNSHKWVCLTFDDGYRDNYTLAYPLLKRLGVPFTVYVTTGFIDNKIPMWWYPGEQLGISTEELKAMDTDPLCTIGAHTCTHPHLSKLDAEQQYQEIADCKSDLENLIGKEVRHMAYPHGDYNQTTVEIVSKLGFVTAVTTSGRHVRNDSRLLELDRVFV